MKPGLGPPAQQGARQFVEIRPNENAIIIIRVQHPNHRKEVLRYFDRGSISVSIMIYTYSTVINDVLHTHACFSVTYVS